MEQQKLSANEGVQGTTVHGNPPTTLKQALSEGCNDAFGYIMLPSATVLIN